MDFCFEEFIAENNKTRNEKNIQFIYKENVLIANIKSTEANIKLTISDSKNLFHFQTHISKDSIPFPNVPLFFFKLLLTMSFNRINQKATLKNNSKISLSFYLMDEIQLFNTFPKYTKEQFSKIKLENKSISGEKLFAGKGLLMRIKISEFKLGMNFDFKLQLSKLLNLEKEKEIQSQKLYLEEEMKNHIKKIFEILPKSI